ncbi:MAG: glycosyltransferase, partial [Desulfobacterales bacterium]|nr:glycosyltransferase [Desulfobacterales bacterium]
IERKLTHTCQRILAPTSAEKQNLIKYYHAAEENIGVVPCGVNLDLFQPRDKIGARRSLGLDENASIALYVGRFDPIKGIDRLLKAIAHLRRQQPVQLLIIGGDGPETIEYQNLERLVHQLGVQDSVTFLGRIEQRQLPPYYSAADLLVIPSYYESFGLVGLESLACGTPVVSTPVGAMSTILQDDRAGLLLNNADPAALADGIAATLTRQRASDFSVADLRHRICQFGWKNVASGILNEYAVIIKSVPSYQLPKIPAQASCLC